MKRIPLLALVLCGVSLTESNFSSEDDGQKNAATNRDKAKAKTDVDEILDKARNAKNGELFSELFDKGDISRYDNDFSAADLALCCILAFWFQKDEALIDTAFRKSALYREKWERADYRTYTLHKAVSCTDNMYQTTAQHTAMTKKIISSKAASQTRTNTADSAYPPFIKAGFSAEWNATIPLDVYRQELAKHIKGKYDFYFVKDHDNDKKARIVLYDKGVYRWIGDIEFQSLITQEILPFGEINPELLRMEDVQQTYNILRQMDLSRVKEYNEFNKDEKIINFKNGILNIDTMQFMPHTSQLLSTIQVKTEYKGPVPTPIFDKFMYELTSGDIESQTALLEYLGACISNVHGYRFKKALLMVGEGNTGKSVLRTLVEQLIGNDYCSGGDLQVLESRFGLMELFNKRIYGSADLGVMAVKELKAFKMITGGDTLSFEEKGKPRFNSKYLGLLWFGCNQLPKFGGDRGQWVYDRMLIIVCDNVVPPERRDPELVNKLMAEASGIVYKAVMALKAAICRGDKGYRFTEPTKSLAVKGEYRFENSPYLSFYRECCMPTDEVHNVDEPILCSQMHKACGKYCKENAGGLNFKAVDFKRELEQIGINMSVRAVHGYRYYNYFTLNEDGKQYLN